jgi:trk system potassium uptake protein
LLLLARGAVSDPLDALRLAFFNVVSIGSTTGYSTTDYTQWPVLAPVMMLMLSGLATSAGSTGAGIKMIRVVILLKQAKREMERCCTPHGEPGGAERALGLERDHLRGAGLHAALRRHGDRADAAAAGHRHALRHRAVAVVASINNMGPGWNEIGPVGSFRA